MYGAVSVNNPTKTNSYITIDYANQGVKAIILRYMILAFEAYPPPGTFINIVDNTKRQLFGLPVDPQLSGQYWLDWVIEGKGININCDQGDVFFYMSYQLITEGKIQ